MIDSLAVVHAPDIREAVFEAELYSLGKNMILRGETNLPEAKDDILSILEKKNIEFIDSLRLLPDPSETDKPWGIVNVSVCNMRLSGSYSSELVSQALMGTPVRILKSRRGWLFVQTPDLYLGWIDDGAIQTFDEEDFGRWKKSQRVIYIKKTGDILSDPFSGRVISDIVAGCILEFTGIEKGFFRVRLPDGREGFLPVADAVYLDDWLAAGMPADTGKLKSTAESFTGIPYWWGGTSVKGFDCSGFVKTVYFLNGIILARDASLQFRHGAWLSKESWPDSLRTGDLLFFGTIRNGRPRATHVGMYIGNSEFIHCSGMVKVNSLDSTRSNFTRSRRDTFLGVRRITGAEKARGIQTVSDHKWYR